MLITNTVLLVLAPLVAGFVRPAGGRHFDPRFALVAAVPLLFLWVLNVYFLWGAFTPLRTLSEFADRVDLLHPGRRLRLESRTAEVVVLTDAINRMPALSEEQELVIHRVAQEALTNVARHSGSQTARLSLHRDGDRVSLEVIDHGRGLADAKPGTGVLGMRERANLVGGSFSIADGRDGGTVVHLTLPGAVACADG